MVDAIGPMRRRRGDRGRVAASSEHLGPMRRRRTDPSHAVANWAQTTTPTSTDMKPITIRNKRTFRLYSESVEALNAGYAQLSRRLFELDLASIKSAEAIDQLMRRLHAQADQSSASASV